jgi:peroxiredoxin
MENQTYMDDFLFEEDMPMVGRHMPDVTLEAYHEGKITSVSTGDMKGKWAVFVFYPADFTFVCPTELEELAGLYGEFQKEGVEVMSISTDTVYTHKAWHDTSEAIGKVTYPMLADPAGILSRALGVYLPDEGVTLRGTFIVNPEGKIVGTEINDNSIGRSAKELLRKVRAAKFVAEHDGKVCPASWNPGDDTLEPGLDLVGKI